MEMYTQTSNCGCSRKNSVMSFSAKNNRQHRLSSTGLRPLHFVDDDSRRLSMASLQIKPMRLPQTSSQGAWEGSTKHYGKSGSKDASDYVNVGRGVAQTRSDYPAGARVGFVEDDDEQSTDSLNLGVGAHGEYVTQNHAKVSSHGLELTPRNYALSRKTPDRFTSPSKTHRTQHYQGGAVSRTVSDMITHGHFVSRKPVQNPRTHSEMHQQGRLAGRERCRSGFAPSATLNQGGKGTIMSATRARRGKSAGDPYCGRPCDACTVQDLIKKKQLSDYEWKENYQGMFIMDTSEWKKIEMPSQEEVPMTTVSVPGRGLPKLTGLKHELADPSFYERHREDVVDSSKPFKEWLKIRKDSDTQSAYIPGKSRRSSSVKGQEKKEEERHFKTKGKSRRGSTDPHAQTAGKRKGRVSLRREKDDEGRRGRGSLARQSVCSSMELEEKASNESSVSLRVKKKSDAEEPGGKAARGKKSSKAGVKPRSSKVSKWKKSICRYSSQDETEDTKLQQICTEIVDENGQTVKGRVLGKEFRRLAARVVDEEGRSLYGKVINDECRKLYAEVVDDDTGNTLYGEVVDEEGKEMYAEVEDDNGETFYGKVVDVEQLQIQENEYRQQRRASFKRGGMRGIRRMTRGTSLNVPETEDETEAPERQGVKVKQEHEEEDILTRTPSLTELMMSASLTEYEIDLFAVGSDTTNIPWGLGTLKRDLRPVEEASGHEASVGKSSSGEVKSIQESSSGEARSVQESLRQEAKSVQESLRGEAEPVQESLRGEAKSVQESLRGEAKSVQESLRTEPGARKPPEPKKQKEIEAMQESMEKPLIKSSTQIARPQGTSEKVGVPVKRGESKNIQSRKAERGPHTLDATDTPFSKKHEAMVTSTDIDIMKTDLIHLAEEETLRQRGLLADREANRQRRLLKLEKQRQEQLFKQSLEEKHRKRLKEEESLRQRKMFKEEGKRVQSRLLKEEEERRHQKQLKEEEERRHNIILQEAEAQKQRRLLKEEEKQEQRRLMEEKEKEYIETLKRKDPSDLTEEEKRRIADSEWRMEYLKGIRKYSSRVIKEADEIKRLWNVRHEAYNIAKQEEAAQRQEQIERDKMLRSMTPAWFKPKALRRPPKPQTKPPDPLTEMTKEFLQVSVLASRKETVQEEERPHLTRMLSLDPVEVFPLAPDTGITIKGYKSDMLTADQEYWERERKKSRLVAAGQALENSFVMPEDLRGRTSPVTSSPEQKTSVFKKKSKPEEWSAVPIADTRERLSVGRRKTEAVGITITHQRKSEHARRYGAASPKLVEDLFRLDGKALQDVESEFCRSTVPAKSMSLERCRSLPPSLEPLQLRQPEQPVNLVAGNLDDEDLLSAERKKEGSKRRARKARRWRPRRMHHAMLLVREQINKWRAEQMAVKQIGPKEVRGTEAYAKGEVHYDRRQSLLLGAKIPHAKYADTEKVVVARTMRPREERSHRVPFIRSCPAPSPRLFESPVPTFDVNPKLLAMREEAHNEYFLQYRRIRRGLSELRTSAPQDTLYHMMYSHARKSLQPSSPRIIRRTSPQRAAAGPKPPLSPYPPHTADTPMRRLFGHLYKQPQPQPRFSWTSYPPLPTPPSQRNNRPSPRVGGKEHLQVLGTLRQDQRDYDSLRITPSRGIVLTVCKGRKKKLLQILNQPQDYIAGESRKSPRQGQAGLVVQVGVMDAKRMGFPGEESHFAGTADKRLVLGIQGKRALPDAGGSKQRCQHVTACGWYDPQQLARRRAAPDMIASMPPVAARHSGKETAAPARYLASPDSADRFFFENKRSMITLDVKVAEMEAYSRMKQNYRPSRREPRVSGTPKPVTVVRKPDMLKHIRLGWQTMQQRKREEMPKVAYHDLLENILVYDVPGTKMQDDYSGLLVEKVDSIDTLCSNMALSSSLD